MFFNGMLLCMWLRIEIQCGEMSSVSLGFSVSVMNRQHTLVFCIVSSFIRTKTKVECAL